MIADKTTGITNMYLLTESQQYSPLPLVRLVTCKRSKRYSVEFIEIVLTEICLDCVNRIQLTQYSVGEHYYYSNVQHSCSVTI